MQGNHVHVSLEFTPNPQTLKYSVSQVLVPQGAMNFLSLEEAEVQSPLAAELFQVPGVMAVMLGREFVTVTKSESGDWEAIHHACSGILTKTLEEGRPIFHSGFHREKVSSGEETEAEKKIKEVIDEHVRPAVAMDGGEITFEKYENGIVYVYLQGSCSGCPSAAVTLKQGVETLLRRYVPEVVEVVSV